jgi:3-hydroxyisobutyrate dehydrogenase
MATIAFIGLGNMGGPMAANLVKAGHKVTAFDLVEASRSQAKADGASIADSASGAVKGADVVVTMLPAGKHVLGVWNDIVPAMTKGALIIDSSTIDVESARQAHALAGKHSVLSVDAPVSGGTGGARGASLTFMCGGDDKAFAAAKPVLEKMGKKIVHCGGSGAGQAAKMQQHDPRHFHDRRVRGVCVGREARSLASGAVRRRLDLVGPVLVADDLLPGAGSGADGTGQQRPTSRALRPRLC